MTLIKNIMLNSLGLISFILALLARLVRSNDVLVLSELPLIPSQHGYLPKEDFGGKKIPRHLWLTSKNVPSSPKSLPPHLQHLMERQTALNWTIHMWNDTSVNDFMETKFHGTLLLWAFQQIHPRVGVARADIWRYAVLWYYGGVYIDDDSDFINPFDNYISENDTLIMNTERNSDTDLGHCYHHGYRNSVMRLRRQYPRSPGLSVFHGKLGLNWLLFASPGNPILAQLLSNIAEAIYLEYHHQSILYKRTGHVPIWKEVICLTGPTMLTATVLHAAAHYYHQHKKLSQHTNSTANVTEIVQVKGGSYDFHDIGGNFRAFKGGSRHNDTLYYVHFMDKEKIHLLKEYDSDVSSYLDRRVIKVEEYVNSSYGIGGQELRNQTYLVYHELRWPIPDLVTFSQLYLSPQEVLFLSRNHSIVKDVHAQLPAVAHRALNASDVAWVMKILELPRFDKAPHFIPPA